MNRKDLEVIQDAVEILERMDDIKKKKCKEDCGYCHDEDEEEIKCELIESLEKDFNAIMKWIFGSEYKDETTVEISKKNSRKAWMLYHSHLPMPRILKSKLSLDSMVGTIFLLLDVYPLYLEEMKKIKAEKSALF